MDFLDIIYRGVRRLFGDKPTKGQTRFEAGQDIVAAVIIVIGGIGLLAGIIALAMMS